MKNAIVFLAHCYPSGLVHHLALLACELVERSRDRDVELYVCSDKNEQHKGLWDLLRNRVPSNRLIEVEDYGAGVYLAIENLFLKYDRVLVHFGGGHNQLRPLSRLRKKFGDRLALVATTHSYQHDNWRRPFVSTFQFLLYRKYVDHIIFQTPYTVRRFYGGKWLMAHDRASVIPLGVEEFNAENVNEPPFQVLGSPDLRDVLMQNGKCNLVYLAIFRPGKGHLWLVRAIMPVLQKNPYIRLFFLGDGPLRKAVCEQIAAYRLERQIICPGLIDRKYIPWILSRCHAAIVASKAETFGHCYLEPGMAGLPIVGTRVGVGEYLIQDMLTGIGFELGDDARLRNAVSFLGKHPDIAKSMGATLHSLVACQFLHAHIALAHIRLYDSLLRES